ncbi:TPA: hypothetical protein LVN10_000445 [Klebsiella michiganensis]|uniref:hypothetical protein n=1 Tax=Klebsiella michiganensis TaxID=1134687 RepID=UPI0022CDCCBC|nr:hypothetical protein [Klebsiella michiganensis]WBK54139.1 hypothetical protein OEE45_08660 [Klebsiella michiganensis]HBM3235633.1 hypothetical protein [Klebsiella michiganensis]
MDTNFFSNEQTTNAIEKFSNELKDDNEDSFQRKRNRLTKLTLKSFINAPTLWHERTIYNTKNSGGHLLEALNSRPINDENINLVFAICYKFTLEAFCLSREIEETFHLSKQVRDCGIHDYNKFDDHSKYIIDFALREMPITMLKTFILSNDIQVYKNITTNLEKANKFNNDWNVEFNKKKKAVDEIRDSLSNYKNAFDFVALYGAFKNLGDKKNRDIIWTKALMFMLSLLILTPLTYEIYITHFSVEPINLTNALLPLIPVMSITIIFIYFFRVVLSNYNSLRTQITQIELRKSLCQFIQDYPRLAKKISNENPETLKKFEDIIFSNIIQSNDGTLPTFEGIEQIVNLIKTIKSS